MTYTIFTVTTEQIAALDAARAVELVADLLWAEARRLDFPTTHVHVSTRITVPDGGIDASVDTDDIDVDKWVDSFIPEERTALQIKTGGSFKPWQKGDIKDELFGKKKDPSKENLGESVRSCLDAKGVYVVVCTGTDPTEEERLQTEGHLKEFFAQCGYPDAEFEVWGQSTLIGLLKPFPSLALKVNGNAKTHFQTHGVWSSQAEMSRPLKVGAKQVDFETAVQKELRRSDQPVHIRVRGEAGIGKTRLVLEATAADDLRPLVLYFDGPSRLLDGELMTELLRDGSELAAILVVDECDLESRARIWNLLKAHSPRIKLMSIYNDLDEPSGTTVVLDPPLLDTAQVRAIIEGYGVPEHDSSRWAEFCDGSPRVAHVIGESLQQHPEDLQLRQPDTAIVWNRYVAGNDDPNSDDVRQRRIVLQHIALFRRFGYGGPVSAEAKAIAKLVETANPQVTWFRFQEIVQFLRDRKVLQGETTLYITPRLLHIKLWADWWEAHGDGLDVGAFLKQLPEQLVDWFYEMFQYARESKVALKITEALLDESGPFGDQVFFVDGRAARFFRALTDAAPKAALRTLQRTIGTWDVEQLLKFDGDERREAVWALEAIAVWRELFPDAARLLLRLAEAENENIGNNATGVFADLFSPGYGAVAPTEAPPDERFPVLKEALESPSKKQREIALVACEHALKTGFFSRMVGAEYQGLRRPPQLWVPKTYGELFDAYRRVWQLLVDRLGALEANERDKAIEVLTGEVRGLCSVEHLFDMVVDTLSDVASKFAESRPRIVRAVEETLHYDGKGFKPEQRARLEVLRTNLVDGDFHSQMERYVGMDLIHDDFDDEGQFVDKLGQRMVALAEQIMQRPELLDAELPWLVTDAAKNGFRFGHELGTLDKEFGLLPKLIEAQGDAGQGANAFFLSGYCSVLFQRAPDLWEGTLDRLVEHPTLRANVPELTWRSGVTERASLRILSLVEAGQIPPASLGMFSYGGVVRKVPEHVFTKWVECLLAANTRATAWTALHLFHFFYKMGDAKLPLPRELTLRVLTAQPFYAPSDSRSGQSEDYDWMQVAKAFLDLYPGDGITIADKLLESFGEKGTISGRFHSQTEQILTRIAKASPHAVWQKIASFLGPPIDSRAFRIKQWLRDGGLTFMPADEVWKWIDANLEKRAWYAATFVPTVLETGSAATSWARELLVRYGDRKDVRSNLHANLSTEMWTGPESSHYQGKKRWLEDLRKKEANPNVLRFIDEFVDSLNHRIEAARIEEERRGF